MSFCKKLYTCQQTGWPAGTKKDAYAMGIPFLKVIFGAEQHDNCVET